MFPRGTLGLKISGQGFVFHFSHFFLLAGTLVFIATKVEDTMKNYAVNLLLERCSQTGSIISYPIYTNINLCSKPAGLGQVKGYDVGVIIVSQEGFVQFKEILIAAENNSQ